MDPAGRPRQAGSGSGKGEEGLGRSINSSECHFLSIYPIYPIYIYIYISYILQICFSLTFQISLKKYCVIQILKST